MATRDGMIDITSPRPLAPGEVHVWRAELDDVDATDCLAVLSATERARARSFQADLPRRRFIQSRGLLREVLAAYVGVPAAQLSLGQTEHGKPRLQGTAPLEFNLSHSQGVWYLAVSRGPIGIDVEVLEPMEDALRLADRVMSPDERRQLSDLPDSERSEAFLRCWTRKEAVTKAFGCGINVDLTRIHVTCGPHPLTVRPLDAEVSLTVQSIPCGPGEFVALATGSAVTITARVSLLPRSSLLRREKPIRAW